MADAAAESSPGFERSFLGFFFQAIKLAPRFRSYPAGLRLLLSQFTGAMRRKRMRRQGLALPPVLVASVTNRCNLSCANCYAREKANYSAGGAGHRDEPGPDFWDDLFRQAGELGIRVVMIAGGEPLERQDILGKTGRHPGILFPVFTNGLMLDSNWVEFLVKRQNILPLVSLEGDALLTDSRRGDGVFGKIREACGLLRSARILFGVSVTVTAENAEFVLSDAFRDILSGLSASVRVFVEYTPLDDRTRHLLLPPERRKELWDYAGHMNRSTGFLHLVFPGDEGATDGCLAAGRGFVHVNASGRLEPCPFAPFSDTDLMRMPLAEGLRSVFLRKVREGHDRLTETGSGCALWADRAWTAALLNSAEEEASGQEG